MARLDNHLLLKKCTNFSRKISPDSSETHKNIDIAGGIVYKNSCIKISKRLMMVVKRVIACILMLMIPSIVEFVMSLAGISDYESCLNKIKNFENKNYSTLVNELDIRNYKPLLQNVDKLQEKIDLLNMIRMPWKVHDNIWIDYYNVINAYYLKNNLYL